MSEMKKCRKCGEDKLAEFHFYKTKRVNKDGSVTRRYRSWCKTCEQERIKGVKARNPALKTWRPKTEEQKEKLRTYNREHYRTTYGKGKHTWKKYRVKNGRAGDRERLDATELIKWFNERPYAVARLPESGRSSLNKIKREKTMTEEAADSLLTAVGEPDQLFAVLGEAA